MSARISSASALARSWSPAATASGSLVATRPRPRHSSVAGCLLPFVNDATKRVVHGLSGAEVRPELGIDGHDPAHAAVHVVTATRLTTKPLVVDLGHLLERFRARLMLLRDGVVARFDPGSPSETGGSWRIVDVSEARQVPWGSPAPKTRMRVGSTIVIAPLRSAPTAAIAATIREAMSAGEITSGSRATMMPGCVPGGNRNAFEKSRSPDTTIEEVSRARAAIASSVAPLRPTSRTSTTS